jgi:hypothetical protein
MEIVKTDQGRYLIDISEDELQDAQVAMAAMTRRGYVNFKAYWEAIVRARGDEQGIAILEGRLKGFFEGTI